MSDPFPSPIRVMDSGVAAVAIGGNDTCIILRNQSGTTEQHSTAQHSTAQHSTAQHSTTQHSKGIDPTAGCLPVFSLDPALCQTAISPILPACLSACQPSYLPNPPTRLQPPVSQLARGRRAWRLCRATAAGRSCLWGMATCAGARLAATVRRAGRLWCGCERAV